MLKIRKKKSNAAIRRINQYSYYPMPTNAAIALRRDIRARLAR